MNLKAYLKLGFLQFNRRVDKLRSNEENGTLGGGGRTYIE